mgnify:CR=1 FL=1
MWQSVAGSVVLEYSYHTGVPHSIGYRLWLACPTYDPIMLAGAGVGWRAVRAYSPHFIASGNLLTILSSTPTKIHTKYRQEKAASILRR